MKFVAVTSCPTGIAHSQMAAEGLEQAAEDLGHDIRIEIQGAMGAEDELTSDEIEAADAVIIAADTSVSRDRFQGKPLVKSAVAKAINDADELLEEAEAKASGEAPTEEDTTTSGPDAGSPTPQQSGKRRQTGLFEKIKNLLS